MTTDYLLQLLVTLAAILIAYHHLGYPILLKLLATWRRNRRRDVPAAPAPEVRAAELPSVVLLVPAHNEAKYIMRKIQNVSRLQYPSELLTVVLAFDGCTDGTPQLAKDALANTPISASVKLVEFPCNVGKVAVLNACIADLHSELVALSDTSAEITSDALVRAAGHFRDPQTGVVCGAYELQNPFNEGERAYWRYQTAIKADEAELAAPMGAHGAFYVFRRSAWTPLETDTINDDFVLPMRIVTAGYRAVYDRDIVALEMEQTTAQQEFWRRVRIGAGNLQQVIRLPRLWDPRRGWFTFVFISGKGLRPFVPFLALIAAGALFVLAIEGRVWAMNLLIAGTTVCISPLLWPRRLVAQSPGVVAWLRYLLEGHAASMIGAFQYMAGMRKDVGLPVKGSDSKLAG